MTMVALLAKELSWHSDEQRKRIAAVIEAHYAEKPCPRCGLLTDGWHNWDAHGGTDA